MLLDNVDWCNKILRKKLFCWWQNSLMLKLVVWKSFHMISKNKITGSGIQWVPQHTEYQFRLLLKKIQAHLIRVPTCRTMLAVFVEKFAFQNKIIIIEVKSSSTEFFTMPTLYIYKCTYGLGYQVFSGFFRVSLND